MDTMINKPAVTPPVETPGGGTAAKTAPVKPEAEEPAGKWQIHEGPREIPLDPALAVGPKQWEAVLKSGRSRRTITAPSYDGLMEKVSKETRDG